MPTPTPANTGRGLTSTPEDRLARILESVSDAFFALDNEWRFTYVNRQAEALLLRPRAELLDRNIWDEFPEAIGSQFDVEYRRAMSTRGTVRFESYYSPLDTWFEVRAFPSADGLAVYFQDISDRRHAQRIAQFAARVGEAVTHGGALPLMMHRCCEAMVDLLGAAFARVWVLNEEERMLHLVASAGMYTHLDGPHARVPVGAYKIGRIAEERHPHLTNAVVGDPRVSDQAWAAREGMVAFAGYPLIVDGRVVGVIAMFARSAMSQEQFNALRTASDAISVAVANVSAMDAMRQAREEAVAAIAELFQERAALEIANERLQDQATELEAQAEELQVITEELVERTAVAEEAQKRAEEANRTKSEFLAMMSHELRTPLNAIAGYAELIDLGLRGEVTREQRADLERIQRAQRHLLGLINGVLNYAKVDAGQVHYACEQVPMKEVLEVCEALIAPQLMARGLRFDFLPCDATLHAWADREKVQQVVLNLLSNAVKFTEPGGAVTLGCLARDEHTVVVRVADTGCGIAEDQVERVFQPFVQVDAALTRAHEGTGLGLAISRDLARGMGGDLAVRSEVGVGSTFTFMLPRHHPASITSA